MSPTGSRRSSTAWISRLSPTGCRSTLRQAFSRAYRRLSAASASKLRSATTTCKDYSPTTQWSSVVRHPPSSTTARPPRRRPAHPSSTTTPPTCHPESQLPTFSIASGSLPPGLRLTSVGGVLYGSPTTAGTFTFVRRGAELVRVDPRRDERHHGTEAPTADLHGRHPAVAGNGRHALLVHLCGQCRDWRGRRYLLAVQREPAQWADTRLNQWCVDGHANGSRRIHIRHGRREHRRINRQPVDNNRGPAVASRTIAGDGLQ